MEAIAAFALACNVAQVIGQAVSAVNVVREVYNDGICKDTAGLLVHQQQLQKVLKEISRQDLQWKQPETRSSIEDQVHEIALNCESIATDLCAELETLQSSGGKRNAVLVGWRALRRKGRLEKLEKRLQRHRQLLETGILVGLRQHVQDQGLLQKGQYEMLDATMKAGLTDVKFEDNQLQRMITELKLACLQRIEESQNDTKKHVDSRFDTLERITGSVREQTQFLESLSFPEMNARINSISDNGVGTFEWIFESHEDREIRKLPLKPHSPHYSHFGDLKKSEKRSRQKAFKEWLLTGRTIFWVQGKAGSGKSTLMRFLWQHEKLKDILYQAYPNQRCSILKYSFWLNGTITQRSLNGFYMTILYQLVQESIECVQSLILEYPNIASKRFNADWSTTELEQVLISAIQNTVAAQRIYIFIDGLDEIGARKDYPRILSFARTVMQKGVKVCVSSRPEPYWCNALEQEETIRLHEMTEEDIWILIHNRFDEAACDLNTNDEDAKKTIEALTEKGQGVFLWVQLATDSVLVALEGRASWPEARAVIDQLPAELNKLYESMLSKSGKKSPLALAEAATYFKACLALRDQVSASLMVSLKAKLEGRSILRSDFVMTDLLSYIDTIQARIPYLSAGMIECRQIHTKSLITESPGKSLMHPTWVPALKQFLLDNRLPDNFAQFSHRTVADFLLDTEAGQTLLSASSLSTDDIFMCSVEASLMEGLLQTCPFDLRTVITSMWAFGGGPSKRVYQQALRKIEATLPEIACVQKMLSKSTIEAISDDERCAQPYSQYDVLAHMGYYSSCSSEVAIDTTGLVLTTVNMFGDHHEYSHHPFVEAKTTGPVMTQRYKDYILLCIVNGMVNWGGSAQVIDLLAAMVEEGADAFAEFGLPVARPRQHCAAMELLSYFYKNQWDVTGQLEQWIRILRCVNMKSQRRIFRVGGWFRSLFHGYDVWLNTGSIPYDTRQIWVELDIGFHLNSILRQMESSYFDGCCRIIPDDQQGHSEVRLMIEETRGWDNYQMDRKAGYQEASILVDEDSVAVLRFVDRCNSRGEEAIRSKPEEEASSSLLPIEEQNHWSDFHRFLLDTVKNSPTVTEADLITILKDKEYHLDVSDPRVPKGPIPRYIKDEMNQGNGSHGDNQQRTALFNNNENNENKENRSDGSSEMDDADMNSNASEDIFVDAEQD